MLAHGIYIEHFAAAVGLLTGTAAGVWSLVRSSRSQRGAVTLACSAFVFPLLALVVAVLERGDAASALAEFWLICVLPVGIGLLAMPVALLESRAARRDQDV